MSIKTRILNNLADRTYPVNPMVTFHGIDDADAGYEALRELIEEGLVASKSISVPGTRNGLPAYQLTFAGRQSIGGLKLVVDNVE